MNKKTETTLTPQQIQDRDFLMSLVALLKKSNLSKLDLKTTGDLYRSHSALVENYEINVRQTPVFGYPKKWHRILFIGKWMFEPGKYERYEVSVSENLHNQRQEDYGHLYSAKEKLGNTVLVSGTMATDLATYPASQRFINHSDSDLSNLYSDQNAHLFDGARQLYRLLDDEFCNRLHLRKKYILPEINDAQARQAMQVRLLENLKRSL